MSTNQAQDFLFRRIRELLPPSASLTDTISGILHVSSDSAYRRIRNETPLVLEEARILCEYFHLSLDQVLNISNHSVLFENTRINHQDYSYERYLSDLIGNVRHIGTFSQKQIIYLTKDIPLFHNFYFQPLIAFRYFFWMKMLLVHPDFVSAAIDLNNTPPQIASLSKTLCSLYTQIPSAEIWNTECVNSVISQIEFCRDSGLFSSGTDIRTVYEAVAESISHVRTQAELGKKFMPGEKSSTRPDNFNFFYNRVILGDNTIFVRTDSVKAAYLNYDVLNYIGTRDQSFCTQCEADLQNLMRRSTLISQTGERQRNIFFGILLNKIQDRMRKV